MTAPLIISVSGLRGEIGRTLTPDVVGRYALAYSSSIGNDRPFIIGNDGRRSGSIYADLIHSILNLSGRSTLDAGIVSTPTMGVLIRTFNAAGGIQISASHNPAHFNGMKLFSEQGRVIPAAEGENVLKILRKITVNRSNESSELIQSNEKAETTASPLWANVETLGSRTPIADTVSAHLQAVLNTIDVDLIRRSHFKVLLDSNSGSGSLAGRPLLEALGCEIIGLGQTPNGLFEHVPEPIEENLLSVCEKVRQSGATIGFCQDPDADRLAFIDETGRFPGEEYTVALCALNKYEKAQKRGLNGSQLNIVINCATSRMSIDLARQFGAECFRSPVGEANVVDRLLQTGSFFAGEGNGGPIDPNVGLVRDSLVGMANLLELMARRQTSIGCLTREIPNYSIVKRKRALSAEKLSNLLELLEDKFSNCQINREDGLRIDREKSWVLVRASNTEPIIRIIAEDETKEKANRFCDEIESVVEKIERSTNE